MAGKLLDLELEMGDQRFRAGIHRLGASARHLPRPSE